METNNVLVSEIATKLAKKQMGKGLKMAEEPTEDYKKLFKIEMDAKNRAYAFILGNGLLNRFSEFSKLTQGFDCHKLALMMLSNETENYKTESHE